MLAPSHSVITCLPDSWIPAATSGGFVNAQKALQPQLLLYSPCLSCFGHHYSAQTAQVSGQDYVPLPLHSSIHYYCRCGKCKMIKPTVEKLQDKYPDITFAQ